MKIGTHVASKNYTKPNDCVNLTSDNQLSGRIFVCRRAGRIVLYQYLDLNFLY